MEEIKISLMEEYTECVIREDEAHLPFRTPLMAEFVDVTGGPAEMVRVVMEHMEHQRLVVVINSQRSFRLVQALNDMPGHHMAIYFQGVWDADAFMQEIEYLENLLVDDARNEYCIGEQLFQNVYATTEGRIILKDCSTSMHSAVPIYKKNDHSKWGQLLMDRGLQKNNLLGRLSDMTDDLTERVLLLQNILCQTELHTEDKIPVMNSILAFSGGHALILDWTLSPQNSSTWSDLCFSVLFGQEYSTCPDVMSLMLERILLSDELPAFFLNDLERAFICREPYGFHRWEAVLLRTKAELEAAYE